MKAGAAWKWRRIAFSLSVTAAAILAVVGLGDVARGAGTVVSLVPSNRTLDVGDALEVEVRATGLTDLAAYEFAIEYDASVLRFVKATHSSFLASTGRSPSCPSPVQIDANEADAVEVVLLGCASSGSNVQGPAGDAELVKLEFESVGDGTSDLLFRKVELALPSGDTCCQIDSVQETSVSVGSERVPPTPRPDRSRLTPTPPAGATRAETYVLTPSAGTSAVEGSRSAPGRPSAGAGRGSRSAVTGSQANGDFPVAGMGPGGDQGRNSPFWPVVASLTAWAGISAIMLGVSRRRA